MKWGDEKYWQPNVASDLPTSACSLISNTSYYKEAKPAYKIKDHLTIFNLNKYPDVINNIDIALPLAEGVFLHVIKAWNFDILGWKNKELTFKIQTR